MSESETDTEEIYSTESDVEFSEIHTELQESVEPPPPKKRRGKRSLISPKLVCVMDSRKVSDRDAVHIIIAIVEA